MIAYPSYGSFLRKDRLKLSTQKLIEDLKYAKMYAISHDSSTVNVLFQSNPGNTNGFNGYWIYIPSAVSNMTLKKVNLPNGVRICPRGEGTTFNTDNKILFKPAGNVAPFACTIALKDLETGEKRYIEFRVL
jgi:Tfp pilus assembly protein FimT